MNSIYTVFIMGGNYNVFLLIRPGLAPFLNELYFSQVKQVH